MQVPQLTRAADEVAVRIVDLARLRRDLGEDGVVEPLRDRVV